MLSHVSETLKAKKSSAVCHGETVCLLCNFVPEFNICGKRNKSKCHTESKPYIVFWHKFYFYVKANFISILYLGGGGDTEYEKCFNIFITMKAGTYTQPTFINKCSRDMKNYFWVPPWKNGWETPVRLSHIHSE
jgi:hypothetical protein